MAQTDELKFGLRSHLFEISLRIYGAVLSTTSLYLHRRTSVNNLYISTGDKSSVKFLSLRAIVREWIISET